MRAVNECPHRRSQTTAGKPLNIGGYGVDRGEIKVIQFGQAGVSASLQSRASVGVGTWAPGKQRPPPAFWRNTLSLGQED